MDYPCIGSNGFAQVGEPDSRMKNKAEMAVLVEYLEAHYSIPDEFSGMCFYRVKWFNHDFGMYSEVVLLYNDRILESWGNNDPEKLDRFWRLLYQVESVDLESESLTRLIYSRYMHMGGNTDLIPVSYESQAS